MGQLITVKNAANTKNSITFVLNRSLTGMENLLFTDVDQAFNNDSPAHVISRRILELGADSVAVYSNVITVGGKTVFISTNNETIIAIIEKLYLYYGANAGWTPESKN